MNGLFKPQNWQGIRNVYFCNLVFTTGQKKRKEAKNTLTRAVVHTHICTHTHTHIYIHLQNTKV